MVHVGCHDHDSLGPGAGICTGCNLMITWPTTEKMIIQVFWEGVRLFPKMKGDYPSTEMLLILDVVLARGGSTDTVKIITVRIRRHELLLSFTPVQSGFRVQPPIHD